jgi:poly(3-hydroxybutyrate) depolymerase
MLLALTLLAFQTPAKPALPAADATKFRIAFAEALAEPDGKSSKLASLAKTLEAKYELESLMAALREGPKLPAGDRKPRKVGKDKEKLQRVGDVTVGFLFQSGKDSFGYLVAVPKKYDASRPAPVVLDPGHGTGKGKSLAEKADFTPYFRHSADSAGLEDALVVRTEIIEQIGADGVKGQRPEDEVAAVFDDLFRDLASRFAIDPDRVFVAGISQTGFWSWYLGRARPDRFAGLAPISAVTWQVDKYLDCYANLPAYVVHGDADPVCPVAQPRRTTKLLKDLGFPVTYVEIAGGEHGGPVFGRLGEALTALAKTPRGPWPKHVSRSLGTTRAPHAYWIQVTKLEKESDGKAGSPPVGAIDATVDGQRVTITSKGVASIELALDEELIDWKQDVEVVWNGKKVHAGPVESSFEFAVGRALAKADWRGVGPARLALNAPR